MRHVILFNMVSLDGFFEGPDHDIDWHRVDEEFNDFAVEQLDSAGGLIFGRVTYQLMESYWPTTGAIADDPEVAERMNSIPKTVFSQTLERVEWNNTHLVKGNLAAEVNRLKEQPGKDLFVFGSGNLAASLIREGLLDEIRLIICPLLLGRGTPMFAGVDEMTNLELLKTKTFRNGNILLYYRVR